MQTKSIPHVIVALATAVIGIANTLSPAAAINLKNRTQAPTDFLNVLQDFRAFVGEDGKLSPASIAAKPLDLSQIKLAFDSQVTVYFIGETAGGYRNRLDFVATQGNSVVQQQTKIFGDTSCNPGDKNFLNYSLFCANPNSALPNTTPVDRPLNIGDFAEVGNFAAGTKLDFLLVPNAINGGVTYNGKLATYGLDTAANPDRTQHVLAHYYKDYLVLGYEDFWKGGDADYNDAVFAIDLGKNNARQLAGVSVPEPTTTFGLMAVGLGGLLKARRRKSNV